MEYLLGAKGLWRKGSMEQKVRELWYILVSQNKQVVGRMLTERQKEHLDDARFKDHQVKHYLF